MNKTLILAACFAVIGCGPDLGLSNGTEGDSAATQMQLSPHGPSFVLVRKDTRKCRYPFCGGYFVREMNRPGQEEVYVRDFEFSSAALADETVSNLMAAPAEEWAFFGVFGADDEDGTRPFLVDEAYQGMPGVRFNEGESFSLVEHASIACIREPCPTLRATEVNTENEVLLHSIDSTHSARTLVDQRWLGHTVSEKRAIAAGVTALVGEQIQLDSSQMFLRLPVRDDPCPKIPVPACAEDESNLFVRNDSRCLIPQGCKVVEPDTGATPPCDEGYTQVSWVGPEGTEYACDPSFAETP